MSPLTQSAVIKKSSSWRHRALDGAVVFGITLGIGLISQRWTGLDTPDSSFYLSLGLYGDAITDRVAEPYYAWTRLGAILPVGMLTDLLGAFPGLEAYRILLILGCVAGAFITIRRFSAPAFAAVLTTIVMLNTVVLSYLGNPYLTRNVLAGTFLIIAIAAASYVQHGQLRAPTARAATLSGALAGVIVGWLVMTNPYGAILAGLLWSVLIVAATLKLHSGATALLFSLLAGVGASLITWGAFLLAGNSAFPRLNWLQTYLDWNAKLTYSDFASKESVWLGDISLLVPLIIVTCATIFWLTNRQRLAAQFGMLLSLSTVALTFALEPIMGGITLEAPMYQAMLWPPLLLAAACSTAAAAPRSRLSWPIGLTSVLAVIAVGLAGRWPGALTFTTGLALAAALTLACCILWVWAHRTYERFEKSINAATIAALAGLAVLLSGAQLLQNSRGDLGLYFLSPYSNAFLDNSIETKVRTAVNAQDFVLQNTTREDRIQLWVGGDWVGGDRELYVVAGMQMWGPNIATLQPTLDAIKANELRGARPTIVEMVAPSMPQILHFWASLPPDANPSAPECYDFTWPSDRLHTGHVCLSRLRWATSP